MSWTNPRTWRVGEIVTKAIMDLHVKDNLRYLKGLDGVPTIESGLIIDNTDGDEYLQIPSLTTTERNALTPVNGMVIYNETTNAFNKYENSAWVDLGSGVDHGGLSGLTDDDHTQYQKENLLTTAGDIPYATGASVWARLGIGAALQEFRTNAGATAPEWFHPEKLVVLKVITDDSNLQVADGQYKFTVPDILNGMNLVDADAAVYTASSSGEPSIAIYNLTQTADMLSVNITIDENELNSYTADPGPTIDTANDDVATGDILRIDVDAAGTGTTGLDVILTFQSP